MRHIRSSMPSRLLRLLALMSVLAVVLAACGSTDGDGAATTTADDGAGATTSTADGSGSDTTASTGGDDGAQDDLAGSSFSFLTVVTEAGDSAYQAAVDAYQAEFPDRSIQYEEISNETYGELVRTRFVGGNPPDLLYVTPGFGDDQALLSLAEAGFLEPLTGTSAEQTIDDNVRQNFEYEGEIYGQALNLVVIASVLNETALETDGVTLPEDYESLLGTCQEVAGAGKSVYVVAGSAPPNTGLFGLVMSGSRVYADNPDWNAQRAAGEVTFAESEGWVNTLEDIVEMNDSGCMQEGVVAGDFAAITNNITTGASYGAFIPSGAAFGLAGEAPDSFFAVHAMPGVTAESTIIFASPNDSLAVASAAPDESKVAAKAFLDWLAIPENLAAAGAAQGWLPPVNVDASTLPPQLAPIGPFLEDGRFVPLPSSGWASPDVYNTFGMGIQGLLAGQTTVEDVLQSMDAAWGS